MKFNIEEDLATTYAGTTLGGPRLRKAMADHINRYFHPHMPVSPSEVLIANGVSAICAMLGFVLGDPGDGVLLMRPIYGKFENDWGITAKYALIGILWGLKGRADRIG
jgi:1-aminocyclopropane-1-carboxylate synthase